MPEAPQDRHWSLQHRRFINMSLGRAEACIRADSAKVPKKHVCHIRLENSDYVDVMSFAESIRRTTALKARAERERGFRYDLVVLMRYDIYFLNPLPVWEIQWMDRLWTSYWCSINSRGYALREIVLNTTADPNDIRSMTEGVFAPSQFTGVGLMDYWFASSSEIIDRFATWGDSVLPSITRYGVPSEQIPAHFAHFYTYLHASALGLKFGKVGTTYIDFRLVRHRHCNLYVGARVMNPDLICTDWSVLMKECGSWAVLPKTFGTDLCPIAGRLATLAPGSRDCGRF